MFLHLLICCVILMFSWRFKFFRLKKFILHLLKQGFITFILFNSLNLSYSVGVDWKYSTFFEDLVVNKIFMYLTLIVVAVLIIGMELSGQKYYGQFKEKFKNDLGCKFYVLFTILYRFSLGLYSSLYSDYEYGTLIIVSFSIAFMLYLITNLPFIEAIHNLRATIIHISMASILIVSNYYSVMVSNVEIEIKGRDFTAAEIEIVLILVCLTLSIIVLIYQVFKIIRSCRKSRRITNYVENQKEGSKVEMKVEITEEQL